jgi:hypothetical protein
MTLAAMLEQEELSLPSHSPSASASARVSMQSGGERERRRTISGFSVVGTGGTEGEVYGTGVGGRDGGDAGREVYERPAVAVGVGVARVRAAAYLCQPAHHGG